MNTGLSGRAAGAALLAMLLLAGCGKSEPALPPPQELEQLATATTLGYAEAVVDRDPARFYAKTAEDYQRNLDFERFKQPFAKFVEANADFMWVKSVRPTFTAPPQLFANGGIRVEGEYAQGLDKCEFVYEFDTTPEGWKVSAMDLRLTGSNGTIP